MKLKRKLFGFLFLTFLITTTIGEVVFAASISSNGGTTNAHLKEHLGSINTNGLVWGWHYSGGYWGFGYDGSDSTYKVYDANVPQYFGGNSKLFDYNISLNCGLPDEVRRFIDVYGTGAVGMKVTVGKSNSVYGNLVSYSLTNSGMSLSFRPILKYDTYNVWGKYNTAVWNAMGSKNKAKIYTPEVTPGYGENYISVRNGAIGLLLTPSIARSAYKASDGTLKFNTSEMAYLGSPGGEQVPANSVYALSNFFSGGSSGVYFRYPVNIEFYDLNINVGNLSITGNEYSNGGVYWVKAGDPFTLNTSASASVNDSLIKVNANYFAVNEGGNTGYVNARIKETSFANTSVDGTNMISILGGRNSRDNTTLNTTLEASLSGDRDISIYTFGRLVRFPNGGATDFSGELIYKNSGYSNSITIKSDSTAPTASSNDVKYDIATDKLSVKLNNVTDHRSGIKSNGIVAVVYPEGIDTSKDDGKTWITLGADGSNYYGSVTFSRDNPTYGKYIVDYWTEDNVGNKAKVSSSSFIRIPPKPVTTSVVIQDYEYEDSTTKWVKADNEFKIHQAGYSLYGNPTESHIRICQNENDKNNTSTSNAYAMKANSFYAWKTNTPHIVRNRETFLTFATKTENSEKRYYGNADYYFLPKAELNGQKFYVFGATELAINGTPYTGDYMKDPKMLGIDAKPPVLNYTSDGNKANITVEDKESGFNRAEVTIGGNKTTYNNPNFSVTSNGSITITVYDNVGNHSTTVIDGTKGWEGRYIQTKIEEINGKKVLKYRVHAEINDLWYDKDNKPHYVNHPLSFTAQSDLYIKPTITKNTNNYIDYSNLVEDKFNVSYGPTLRYDHNNSTYSYLRWDHIEDIEDPVDLRLYKDGSPWDSARRVFASGRKNYQWTLYQTKDRYGNAITKKKVSNGTITGTEVNMSSYKTGSYEMEVTMYDYNGNPSGKSTLKFDHVQPHVNTDVSDLFLKVTAVKDLNWESMNYPIKYNSLEFPLGKNKLSKNGEGIKLGYVVNFSIENLVRHNLSSYSATYSLLGENGEIITGESRGTNFTDLDRRENTGYLSQNNTHITLTDDPNTDPGNNGFRSRLFFKHFLPADAEFRTTDGRPYRGKVTVRMKINLKEVGSDGVLGNRDYTVDLYTIDTSGTAYDDLYIDKQR